MRSRYWERVEVYLSCSLYHWVDSQPVDDIVHRRLVRCLLWRKSVKCWPGRILPNDQTHCKDMSSTVVSWINELTGYQNHWTTSCIGQVVSAALERTATLQFMIPRGWRPKHEIKHENIRPRRRWTHRAHNQDLNEMDGYSPTLNMFGR